MEDPELPVQVQQSEDPGSHANFGIGGQRGPAAGEADPPKDPRKASFVAAWADIQKSDAQLEALEAKPEKPAMDRDYPVGKSLLINKMRRLKPGAAEWAPTGVKETTLRPMMYTFPGIDKVRLWDLPGAGTPGFPKEPP
eukprot:s37_g43.t1